MAAIGNAPAPKTNVGNADVLPGGTPPDANKVVDGVVPGEGVPLPDGEVTGANAQAKAGGAKETGSTDAPKQPTVKFENDGVDKSQDKRLVDMSPLGEPQLPEGDTKQAGVRSGTQADQTNAVTGVLGDILKQAASFESLKQVTERVQFLAQNPDQSMVTQFLGADFGQKFAGLLAEMPGVGNERLLKDMETTFGPFAANMAKDYLAQVEGSFAKMFNDGAGMKALGGLDEKTWDNCVDALTSGFETLKPFLAGGEVSPEAMRQLSGVPEGTEFPELDVLASPLAGSMASLNPYGALGKAGALEGKGERLDIAQMAKTAMLCGEGGIEYMLGLASKLTQGDHKGQMEVLMASLNAVKAQKEGLMKQLHSQEAKMGGLEYGSAVQAQKAKEAAEKAKTWSIVKAVLMVVVAVVVLIVAVVISVFTFGAAAPGMAAVAFTVCGIACSAAVACTLSAIAAAAAAIMVVITILQNLPQLMQAIAALFKAMGAESIAASLEEGAAWWQENVCNNSIFKTFCLVATIVCAVCSLGSGVGIAGAGGAALQAGSQAAQAASALQAVKYVGAVQGIASGAMNMAIAAGQNAAAQQMIDAQEMVTRLKGLLAKVENEFKLILKEIEFLRTHDEGNEQERIKEEEEHLKNINKSLQACADLSASISESSSVKS